MHKRLGEKLINNRIKQLIVNEMYNTKKFKVPIHLALGHEAIAIAITENVSSLDSLVLSHRNIHYNLCQEAHFKTIIDEYLGKASGLVQGTAGSMNLFNSDANIPYTSSILGNNLSVATGMALASKVKSKKCVTFVVTGDGAMEEGAFYEALVFAKTYSLKLIILVENNHWSLATRIEERRCEIDLSIMCQSLGINYVPLSGNDVNFYTDEIAKAKRQVVTENNPVVIECELHSLGDWIMTNEANPNGKYINYHAGPAPEVNFENGAIIHESKNDPLFVLKRAIGEERFEQTYREQMSNFFEYLV